MPPPPAPVARRGRSVRVTLSDETMQSIRVLVEESRRMGVIGYIAATVLPEHEVLEEWVVSTFPQARDNWCMRANGYFEMKFASTDARDEALAGSPYDLAGAHWITLSPWREL